jgi:hypothetical protein
MVRCPRAEKGTIISSEHTWWGENNMDETVICDEERSACMKDEISDLSAQSEESDIFSSIYRRRLLKYSYDDVASLLRSENVKE